MKQRKMGFFGLALVLVVVPTTSLAVAGQGEGDLAFGTWHLVLEKSIYRVLPPPREEQRVYAPHPAGMQTTIMRVDADGVSQTISYVSAYDSVEYPIVGSTTADSISWVPIDARTAEGVVRHAGTVIATVQRSVSPDRQAMTITVLRDGKTEVRVYEKRE